MKKMVAYQSTLCRTMASSVTGLSKENEMEENATSLLLVRGMFLHEHFHFSNKTDWHMYLPFEIIMSF